jgi:AraC family transcriptional regulator
MQYRKIDQTPARSGRHHARGEWERGCEMSVVAKALWFIENHFGRCPSLDDVARASGTTRFHLSRSFSWAVGQPVMSYVRGRRLTEAYKALSDGAPSILRIALDAGYSSHEAFTRAFRDQFGLTPEQARQGRIIEKHLLVEPIAMDDTTQITLAEPRIAHRDALTLVGLGVRFRMDAIQGIPSLWQRFQAYEGTLGEVPGFWYGVCGDWGESGEDFFYMAGVEVIRDTDIPKELTRYRLPAQDYLVFRHDGHLSGLRHTMGAIFERYLPEHGYDPASMKAFFELYDEKFDPVTGLGGIELWMPATKKGERLS